MAGRAVKRKKRAVSSSLPDAELDVLVCLWRRGPAPARDLRESLSPYRSMTHGAITTLLKRLEAKGLVSKEKGSVGKAFMYRATSRPEPIYRRIVKDVGQRLFGGSRLTMFASLFSSPPPTPEELQAIEAFLRERKPEPKKEEK